MADRQSSIRLLHFKNDYFRTRNCYALLFHDVQLVQPKAVTYGKCMDLSVHKMPLNILLTKNM